MIGTNARWCAAAILAAASAVLTAQQTPPPPPAGQTVPAGTGRGGARQRPEIPMDPERARPLYVSKDPRTTRPASTSQRDIQAKAETDSATRRRARASMDFQKVTYRSSVGDMDIPAYLFQPLQKRGAKGHAAMVWVHGGVHGNWGITMLPFVKEAVDRGYVVICSRVPRQHRLRRGALQRRSTTAATKWTTR